MNGQSLFLFSINLFVTIQGAVIPDRLPNARPAYHVEILNIKANPAIYLCDGAIIGPHHILTAANCIYNMKLEDLRVKSASDLKGTYDYLENRQFHAVDVITYPADYVHTPCRAHVHDIAILKLNRSFDLSSERFHKKLNLPELSNDYVDYATKISYYNRNHVLNEVNTIIITNEECSKNASTIVTAYNICANLLEPFNYGEKPTGSPLVHENIIVGIMNVPVECGYINQPSIPCYNQLPSLKIFTRVTAYLGFINKVLNKELSSDIVYRFLRKK